MMLIFRILTLAALIPLAALHAIAQSVDGVQSVKDDLRVNPSR